MDVWHTHQVTGMTPTCRGVEPVPGPAALLPTQLPPTSQTQADSPSAEAPALPVGEGGAASGSWLLPAQPLGVGH